MIDAAMSTFGRIDILINNAAIRPHKPFTELTLEDWEHVRGVVLDGSFYTTRGVIQQMVDNNFGRIVFLTGDGAFRGTAQRAHVSAAKMGLVGMARALASEFAPHNIRVNVIAPGSIDTSRANPEWYAGRVPDSSGIPLGRQGKPEEIASAVTFLCTDDGGFVTGQTLHVNGGQGTSGKGAAVDFVARYRWARDMIINRIQVLNYGCLRYVDVPMDRFHVLIGPNASGKSTLMDAIKFVSDVVRDGVEAAWMKRTSNFADLVWDRPDEPEKQRFEMRLNSGCLTRCAIYFPPIGTTRCFATRWR